MSITIKFDPNITTPQEKILPDADETTDGMMSALQRAKLDDLFAASGLPVPTVTDRTHPIFITPSESGSFATIIPNATVFNDGVFTSAQVRALNALWDASGLPVPTVNGRSPRVRYTPSLQRRQLVINVTVGAMSGLASALMIAKLAALTNVSVSYNDVILAKNPSLFWPLNDAAGSPTVVDLSGNGLDGTVVGPITLGAPGLLSDGETAMQGLGGTTGAFTSGPLLGAGAGPSSIEIWGRPDALTNGSLTMNAQEQATGAGLTISWNADGSITYGSSTGTVFNTAPGVVQVGQRYYVALTWDDVIVSGNNATLRLYVNGALVATQVIDRGNINAAWDVVQVLGADFTTLVEKAVVYNAQLTDAQVLENYQAGIA